MNYEAYYKELNKTLLSKMWWLDKIDDSIDTIIDFGCSNGSIFNMIEYMAPGRFTYIGVDNDEIKLADARKAFEGKKAYFYNSLDLIEVNPDKTMVLLSSVLHELFSYLSSKEALDLVMEIFDLNCKYIAIRDMRFEVKYGWLASKDLNIAFRDYIGWYKDLDKDIALWRKLRPEVKNAGNDVEDTKNLVEFLMSYIHRANLERELSEHYFDIDYGFISEYAKKNYRVMWENRFRLPYLERKWRNELFSDEEYIAKLFDTFINNVHTHTELLYERK